MAAEDEKIGAAEETEEFEEVELEYSEDDILYFLVDEDDVEVGFVIEEDGQEVECYYEEFADLAFEVVEESAADGAAAAGAKAADASGATDAKSDIPEDPSYLRKIATIAGHEGGKVAKKAEAAIGEVRGKATEQAKKAKEKADELDLGITRDDVAEMTSDLNEIAREGAATAKELKETYDELMNSIGFLMPKGKRRR